MESCETVCESRSSRYTFVYLLLLKMFKNFSLSGSLIERYTKKHIDVLIVDMLNCTKKQKPVEVAEEPARKGEESEAESFL